MGFVLRNLMVAIRAAGGQLGLLRQAYIESRE
jgi:hypothetical protein